MTTRSRTGRWWRRDDGVAAAWTLLTIPIALIALGLVLDTGTGIQAWNTDRNHAADAARTGAQQIDLARYRQTGTIQLDPAAAAAAARAYLATVGATGTATATVTTVTVTVTSTTPTQLLNLAGVRTLHEQATQTATPLHGVTAPVP
ncbi:hypothetical protein GCM10023322_68700 [Rugosimonospora acidiphila]|uniref:Flp pilus-assembly TadG-like N-terminal domain-containing protein n=1 Tax=Rugosimonospora acidiphila TaxID=556531 RepID=A0ABP9SLH3_9ACTN